MLWGYDRHLWKYQGGMNDHGLFVDINALGGFSGWQDSPSKPTFGGDLIEHTLTQFATVDEVIDFFQEYDVDLGYVKYVFADSLGKSAIFEWLNGAVNVVDRKGAYQVSTNYLSPKEHTEWRNQTAQKILESGGEPTVALIRRVLSATAYNVFFNQTVYSTICDLKKRIVYLYDFHNFEEVVVFDVGEELRKGKASYTMEELFEIRPYGQYWFNMMGSKLGAEDFLEFVEENGIEAGIERFHLMRAETKVFHPWVFEEWLIRSMGLKYLADGKTKEAIEVFKLNVELYPESWEVYSNLAEAYLAGGDTGLSIEQYRKVLDINPEAHAVRETLDILTK